MHIRMTSKRRKTGQSVAAPTPGPPPAGAPRLPHERDESSDSQAAATAQQQAVGQQAHADLRRGLTDTDKGPAMDKTYKKVKGMPRR
ncbi:MAG: hypothetical protein KF740_13865 [Ramlibacter sp.]|nr:hypothetical protein [Ramlibacter sp.]